MQTSIRAQQLDTILTGSHLSAVSDQYDIIPKCLDLIPLRKSFTSASKCLHQAEIATY